jgi:hypothetical protein
MKLVGFLKKVKNVYSFFKLAFRKNKMEVFKILALNMFQTLMFFMGYKYIGLYIGLFISIFFIGAHFYLITMYEIQLDRINKTREFSQYISVMLNDIYYKVTTENRFNDFTLYISQEVFDFISDYPFVEHLNIVIERDRHGMSYGYSSKKDMISEFDKFFEISKN